MSVSALWAPRRGVSTLICLVLVCGEDPNYKDLSYDLTSRDSKTCETLEFQKTIKVPLKNSCNNKLITFFSNKFYQESEQLNIQILTTKTREKLSVFFFF